MIVKIDNIHFTASNTFFMDYLICNCLRSVTPVAITVSNIHIKSVAELSLFYFSPNDLIIKKMILIN